jgi:hypothetical protein
MAITKAQREFANRKAKSIIIEKFNKDKVYPADSITDAEILKSLGFDVSPNSKIEDFLGRYSDIRNSTIKRHPDYIDIQNSIADANALNDIIDVSCKQAIEDAEMHIMLSDAADITAYLKNL